MRVPALLLLTISVALFATACTGPENANQRIEEACERQREEVLEEESGTPTAESTEERLDEVTLVECAGQETKIVDPGAESPEETGSEGEGEGDGPAEGEGGEGEGDAPAGGEGDAPDDMMPVELDPEARDLFSDTCGICHELSDAGTTGAVGPNLDETTMTAEEIEEQILNGAEGMPAGLLEGEDATAVATYVAGAAGQAQAE